MSIWNEEPGGAKPHMPGVCMDKLASGRFCSKWDGAIVT